MIEGTFRPRLGRTNVLPGLPLPEFDPAGNGKCEINCKNVTERLLP